MHTSYNREGGLISKNSREYIATILCGCLAYFLASTSANAQTIIETTPSTLAKSQNDYADTFTIEIISSDDLQSVNTINVEQYLNTLPQFIPGLDATSAFSGNVSTLDLRGSGPKQTLILINGQRITPVQTGQIVDLNLVPASVLDRIEIIDGGASAQFGSGAMSGVVNLITDTDFEGIELNSSYEITEHGDGAKKDISLKLGGQFDNGRGHAMMFAGFTQRDAVYRRAREHSRFSLRDRGTFLEQVFSYILAQPVFFINDLIDFVPALGVDPTNCPSGTFSSFGRCLGTASFDANNNVVIFDRDDPNRPMYNATELSYLQKPQERYSISASSAYQLSNRINLELSAHITSQTTNGEIGPASDSSDIFVNSENNTFFPPELRSQIQSISRRIAVDRLLTELGPRGFERETSFQNFSAKIATETNSNWDFEVGALSSRSTSIDTKTGEFSSSTFDTAILNNDCHVFVGQGNIAQDCIDLISRTVIQQDVSSINSLSASIAGTPEALKSPFQYAYPSLNWGASFETNGSISDRTACSVNLEDQLERKTISTIPLMRFLVKLMSSIYFRRLHYH